MKRENGFYWVKYNDCWIVAEYYNEKWFVPGNAIRCDEKSLTDIDETPITRPSQSRKLLSTAQTLATLKETLADFPDTLLLTHVHIEMHNKFSIQITEFNAENTQQNEPQKGN